MVTNIFSRPELHLFLNLSYMLCLELSGVTWCSRNTYFV